MPNDLAEGDAMRDAPWATTERRFLHSYVQLGRGTYMESDCKTLTRWGAKRVCRRHMLRVRLLNDLQRNLDKIVKEVPDE